LSRPGYEAAWDGAGNPFPKGERDDRIVATVDALQKKRTGCLEKFNREGSAGCSSSPSDVRAFSIDEHPRRARSEPPQPQTSRLIEMRAMQAFGVHPAIESAICGRRQNIAFEPLPASRQHKMQRAAECGDMEGATMKKHFFGSCVQAEVLSARQTKAKLQSVDIDSHGGKSGIIKRAASEEVLPFASPGYSLECRRNCGAWSQSSRTKSYGYFEKTLAAEKYAKLLGRPNVQSDSKFNKARLALQAKAQHPLGAVLDTIIDETEIGDAETDSPPLTARTDLTDKSTAASQGSMESECRKSSSAKKQLPSLGDARRRKAEVDLMRMSMKELRSKAQALGHTGEELSACLEFDASYDIKAAIVKLILSHKEVGKGKSKAAPLALSRVVSSLVVDKEMLSNTMVQELMQTIESSADVIRNARVAQRSGTSGVGGQLHNSIFNF
jgi:hypothetical protein